MLLVWASVNYFRFHGKERRKARPAPSVESDAEWTKMTPAALAAGRGMKDLVCIHDEHGILIRLEPRFSEERAATATPARRHPASTSPALAEVRQQAPVANHSASAVRTPPDDSASDSDLPANKIEEIIS